MLSSLPVAVCLLGLKGVESPVQHHRDTGLVQHHSCLCYMFGFSPAVGGFSCCVVRHGEIAWLG